MILWRHRDRNSPPSILKDLFPVNQLLLIEILGFGPDGMVSCTQATTELSSHPATNPPRLCNLCTMNQLSVTANQLSSTIDQLSATVFYVCRASFGSAVAWIEVVLESIRLVLSVDQVSARVDQVSARLIAIFYYRLNFALGSLHFFWHRYG